MSAGPSLQESLLREKRALRQEMREQRERLDAAERARANQAATDRLAALPELLAAATFSAFVPTRGELDLSAIVAARAAAGARVALPRVTEGQRQLRFHLVDADTTLRPGAYGILEPPASSPEVPLDELDVLLMPGLAFDDQGRRLGYGGGYYDQTIRVMEAGGRRRGFLVGVGFDFQLISHCPAGEGDVTIDCVVTDARLVRCGPR